MSDFDNGRPPGQNNLDATVERYVDPSNDPSANAVKPDSEHPKESGIEAREETKPEVQQELTQAAKNIVEPGSVEDNKKKEGSAAPEPDEEEEPPPPPPKPAAATVRPLPPSTTRK